MDKLSQQPQFLAKAFWHLLDQLARAFSHRALSRGKLGDLAAGDRILEHFNPANHASHMANRLNNCKAVCAKGAADSRDPKPFARCHVAHFREIRTIPGFVVIESMRSR